MTPEHRSVQCLAHRIGPTVVRVPPWQDYLESLGPPNSQPGHFVKQLGGKKLSDPPDPCRTCSCPSLGIDRSCQYLDKMEKALGNLPKHTKTVKTHRNLQPRLWYCIQPPQLGARNRQQVWVPSMAVFLGFHGQRFHFVRGPSPLWHRPTPSSLEDSIPAGSSKSPLLSSMRSASPERYLPPGFLLSQTTSRGNCALHAQFPGETLVKAVTASIKIY